MTHDEFKHYLALYGANPAGWPEMLRAEAEAHGELLAEEAAFEAEARLRAVISPDESFAERIISAALATKRPLTWKQRLALIAEEIALALPMPRPAYAFAAVAVMGFALGFYMQQQATTDTIAYTNLFADSEEVI
jgi:hypothetical protein